MKKICIVVSLLLSMPFIVHAENTIEADPSSIQKSTFGILKSKFKDKIPQNSPTTDVKSSIEPSTDVSNDKKFVQDVRNLKNLTSKDAVDYLSSSTANEIKNDVKNIPTDKVIKYFSTNSVDEITKDVTGKNLSDIIPSDKIDQFVEKGKSLDTSAVTSLVSDHIMKRALASIVSMFFSYFLEIGIATIVFAFISRFILRKIQNKRKNRKNSEITEGIGVEDVFGAALLGDIILAPTNISDPLDATYANDSTITGDPIDGVNEVATGGADIADATVGVADAAVGVADAAVGVADAAVGVAEATVVAAEATASVAGEILGGIGDVISSIIN